MDIFAPFRRLWRRWFGPVPLPGVYWRLDSGDEVIIVTVTEETFAGYKKMVPFSGAQPVDIPLIREGSVEYRFEEGDTQKSSLVSFSVSGYPIPRPRYFPLPDTE